MLAPFASPLGLVLAAPPPDGPKPPALPDADRTRLAEAFRLADALNNRVWPDWDQAPFTLRLAARCPWRSRARGAMTLDVLPVALEKSAPPAPADALARFETTIGQRLPGIQGRSVMVGLPLPGGPKSD